MPPQEPIDLLIEARWVLPIAPVNTILADHAVAITAGRIVALGPRTELSARFAPRERVVRGEHVLLPGFVNAHTHAAMTLQRGWPLGESDPRCRTPDFVRQGTQLAIAEMLQAGITSFADMSLFPDEAARVARAAHVRAAIGLPVADGATPWAEDATGHLARAERLWDEYKSDPRVSLFFSPCPVHMLSDPQQLHDKAQGLLSEQTLTRVRRVADELDARVAMRIGGGDAPSLPWLQELGLLRPGFTGIAAARLDQGDLDIVGITGMSLVMCPRSHREITGFLARIGRGIPGGAWRARPWQHDLDDALAGGTEPIAGTTWVGQPAVRDAGGEPPAGGCVYKHVPIGLGTGSPMRVGALDVLAEARSAALAAGLAFGSNAQALAAEDFLRMATLGGATALGLGSAIGSIEPGKAADLICVDLGTLACQPAVRPLDTLLFAATRQQVSDVWTSGRAALRDGFLLAFDEQELLAIARDWAKRTESGERR